MFHKYHNYATETVMFKLLLAWQLLVLMLMLVLLLRARDWDNCELEMLGGNDITISGARDHKTQHCAVPPPTPGYCITVIVPCPRRVPPHRPRSGQGWCTMGSTIALSEKSHQAPLRDDDESADMHWHYSVLAMINSSYDMQSLDNSWVTWYLG